MKQRRGDCAVVDLASTPHDAVVCPPVHVVPATGTQSGSAAFFANNADAPPSRKRAHKEDHQFVGAAKQRVIDVHPAVLHHVQRLNAEVQHWRRYAAAAARQVQAKDEEVDAARWLNLLLQEQAHAAHAEARAWRDAAAALRSDLGHALLRAQPTRAHAEDDNKHAESCCSSSNSNNGGKEEGDHDACRGCGERGAAVVLLPCRHLSACAPCAAAARACPACGTPNAGSVAVNPMY